MEALDGFVAIGGGALQRVLEEERAALSQDAKAKVKREWIGEAIEQMSIGDPHGYALELREAFLGASAKVLPGVVWRELSVCELEYPSPSPVLGPLTVEFESDQVTLYCGGHHLHFSHDGGDIRDDAHKAAADALSFILDLTSDAIIVRWALHGSWTVRASRSSGVLWRWWRRINPRAREAVWSGRPLA